MITVKQPRCIPYVQLTDFSAGAKTVWQSEGKRETYIIYGETTVLDSEATRIEPLLKW